MKENKPILSIIIPFYNKADFIHDTLLSIYNSNFYDYNLTYEVIIIDDGSDDYNSKFLSKLLEGIDINHKLFKQDNAGVSNARNTGIKKSSGKYLYFLDADDLISTTFVDDDLIFSIDNDASFIWANLMIGNSIINLPKYGVHEFSSKLAESCFNSRVLHLSAILFNANSVNSFNERFSSGEDLLFIFDSLLGVTGDFQNRIFGSYLYDGKFHLSDRNGLEEVLTNKSLEPSLKSCINAALNERQFLSHMLLGSPYQGTKKNIRPIIKILGFFRSISLYEFIQKIRFR